MLPGNKVTATSLYVAAFILGCVLFHAGHLYATGIRGYEACGGEALLLLLPVYVRIIRSCVKDMKSCKKNEEGFGDE